MLSQARGEEGRCRALQGTRLWIIVFRPISVSFTGLHPTGVTLPNFKNPYAQRKPRLCHALPSFSGVRKKMVSVLLIRSVRFLSGFTGKSAPLPCPHAQGELPP